MRFASCLAFAAVALSTLASASSFVNPRYRYDRPLHVRQSNNSGDSATPCATVASHVSAFPAAYPSLPAKMAYDCLNTIPLNVSSAYEVTKALRRTIQWQSTLAYLKSPPPEYVEKIQDPVDIEAGLAAIETNVSRGTYLSEYAWGVDIYKLLTSAHDGHFSFMPDSLGLFLWARPVSLVSVSDDGKDLPGVFVVHDVVNQQFKNATYIPSAVAEINDQPAQAYLESFSQLGALQDRDALYNNLFFSLPQTSLADGGSGPGTFSGAGRGRWVYPGPHTKLTFANGTIVTYENYATVRFNAIGITSGEDVASRAITYHSGRSRASGTDTADVNTEDEDLVRPGLPENDFKISNPYVNTLVKRQSSALSPAPGYPKPLVNALNLIGGYYLDGPDFEDVAVLSVPSFVALTTYSKPFQNASDTFIQKAKAAGKTKLIIDLQANGGGTILQAYDLFKKLFPDLDPYGGSRFRATNEFNAIGQVLSNFSSQYPRERNMKITERDLVSTPWNYRSDMDANGQAFESWEEKFGPQALHEDKFTNVQRWNLSDVLLEFVNGGFNITGHGDRVGLVTQRPFEPQNIVMITDSYCASTCAIFTEFMRQQAGVKIIAFGGRSNSGPMQAVGGTKGVQTLGLDYVQQVLAGPVLEINEAVAKAATLDELYGAVGTLTIRSARNTRPTFNARDGIRKGDEDQTPLQFVYEEADCRIFYTSEMIVDVTSIWKAAADTTWNGISCCVSSGSNLTVSKTKVKREASTKLTRRNTIKQRGGIDPARLYESLDKHPDPTLFDQDVFGLMPI